MRTGVVVICHNNVGRLKMVRMARCHESRGTLSGLQAMEETDAPGAGTFRTTTSFLLRRSRTETTPELEATATMCGTRQFHIRSLTSPNLAHFRMSILLGLSRLLRSHRTTYRNESETTQQMTHLAIYGSRREQVRLEVAPPESFHRPGVHFARLDQRVSDTTCQHAMFQVHCILGPLHQK